MLACTVGDTETETFWTETFHDLRPRGLSGVRLVISGHHEGPKAAIARCFVGAGWQRCRVHVMRNVLSKVTKTNSDMVAAAIDLWQFSAFPFEHWRKIWSTNPLERLHREITLRSDVVGVFPNDAAIDRLVTAVIVEQHDERAVAERRYLSETSTARLKQHPPTNTLPTPARRKRLAS